MDYLCTLACVFVHHIDSSFSFHVNVGFTIIIEFEDSFHTITSFFQQITQARWKLGQFRHTFQNYTMGVGVESFLSEVFHQLRICANVVRAHARCACESGRSGH